MFCVWDDEREDERKLFFREKMFLSQQTDYNDLDLNNALIAVLTFPVRTLEGNLIKSRAYPSSLPEPLSQ